VKYPPFIKRSPSTLTRKSVTRKKGKGKNPEKKKKKEEKRAGRPNISFMTRAEDQEKKRKEGAWLDIYL